MTANRLRRTYGRRECRITVVGQDDDHLYQPGLLFVPFGLAQPRHLVRSRPRRLDAAVDYRAARIERVAGGVRLPYDVLVAATGVRPLPEETEGLTGPGWGEKVFTFHDLPGAAGLHDALERFEGGRVVIDVADLPLKCPVAPLGFAFPADCHFQRRGIRDRGPNSPPVEVNRQPAVGPLTSVGRLSVWLSVLSQAGYTAWSLWLPRTTCGPA
ncbi:MAG TPA: FAD/NAD(P)-binding oxidoreductase [Streptomyces sp.]